MAYRAGDCRMLAVRYCDAVGGRGFDACASVVLSAVEQDGGEGVSLMLSPIAFDAAAEFVRLHHRHHTPPVGHKFSLSAMEGETLVGVAIVGRPVSRHRDDGRTLEVTRLCTNGHRNACSFLYGAAAKATFALGYSRIGTYILKSEPGSSVKAAGWKLIGETPGKSWSVPSRPRDDKHPLEQRELWERAT